MDELTSDQKLAMLREELASELKKARELEVSMRTLPDHPTLTAMNSNLKAAKDRLEWLLGSKRPWA